MRILHLYTIRINQCVECSIEIDQSFCWKMASEAEGSRVNIRRISGAVFTKPSLLGHVLRTNWRFLYFPN